MCGYIWFSFLFDLLYVQTQRKDFFVQFCVQEIRNQSLKKNPFDTARSLVEYNANNTY